MYSFIDVDNMIKSKVVIRCSMLAEKGFIVDNTMLNRLYEEAISLYGTSVYKSLNNVDSLVNSVVNEYMSDYVMIKQRT